MHHTSIDDLPFSSTSNSVTTRAEPGPGNNTAQPSLTSGFGAVIDKERDLQAATEGSLGHVRGAQSHNVDRILRHQQSRLGANIALLAQRYEALPSPERFATKSGHRPHATDTAWGIEDGDEPNMLRHLVARHAALQSDIEALIECAPDGQRGELILREIRRNHEDMAWMLTALLTEGATSSKGTNQAGQRWGCEGGLAGPVR